MTEQGQEDQGQENRAPGVTEDEDEEEEGVNDPRNKNKKQHK